MSDSDSDSSVVSVVNVDAPAEAVVVVDEDELIVPPAIQPEFIVKLGKTPGTTLIPSLQGLTDVKKGRVKTLNYFVTGNSTGWMRTEIFTEIVETYLEIISPMLSSSEKQVLIPQQVLYPLAGALENFFGMIFCTSPGKYAITRKL
eukprot:PhM_4_TR3073/c1_g3_i3/m.102577